MSARLWLSENRRGRTSHDRSPSIVLAGAEATLAVHLGWSGNHVLGVEPLDDGRRLIHAGELFEPGEMRLAAGETYRSPVLYLAQSTQALRDGLRRAMTWPEGVRRPRPVTLNTWEGTYFDHRLAALTTPARSATGASIRANIRTG